MKHLFVFFGLLFTVTLLFSQSRIDGSFAFSTNPAKKYSLYIPSAYTPGTAHAMMVGMHPLNTNRWDGKSWCDTLTAFAETNNLLLVCPDGGTDGNITGLIDTSFTTTLLDSVRNWYNIDRDKTYIMGFSFGGRATYTYGLSNPGVFKGLIPIGAAINNLNEVSAPLQANANCHPIYILHGSFDNPNARYTPVRNALSNSGAIVNSLLMSGVGHTIDFPNRNQILTTAFQWIDSVNNVIEPLPTPAFSFMLNGMEASFSNQTTGGSFWFWDFGDGTTDTAESPDHTYAPGNYVACLTARNINGCSETVCDSVSVLGTAIGDGVLSRIHLYPNPVEDVIIISLPDQVHQSNISIWNMKGERVQDQLLTGGENTVEISMLPTGIYLVWVEANGEDFAKKIVVK